jgi:hypothetical protein
MILKLKNSTKLQKKFTKYRTYLYAKSFNFKLFKTNHVIQLSPYLLPDLGRLYHLQS